ncbi:hypothetical protein [Kibdelosporangium philippinense]|uniref:hypothetical protein n=1 Tax=Kibdelosporangium philippinense TaxID=211113 RepID=UPI0036088C7A
MRLGLVGWLRFSAWLLGSTLLPAWLVVVWLGFQLGFCGSASVFGVVVVALFLFQRFGGHRGSI